MPLKDRSPRVLSGQIVSADGRKTLTITDIKTATLEAPWDLWTRHWLLVRIDTAEGLQGYADTSASPQVRAEVMGFRDLLVGEDPTDVERLHRRGPNSGVCRDGSGLGCKVIWPKADPEAIGQSPVRLRVHLKKASPGDPRLYAVYLDRN